MTEPATLAAALLRHRLSAGWTQAQLARRAGVSVRTVRALEQGQVRSPRLRSLQRLASALGLTAADRDRLVALVRAQVQARPPAGAGDRAERRAHVAVLGPLSIRAGEEPVELVPQLQRTLLGFLALHPGQAVSTASMIDVLWGDDPPPSCRAVLRGYVAQLRKLLEPDRRAREPARTLVWAGGGYRLDLAAAQLDLARFQELVAEGRQARADGSPALACDLLGQALQCWRGPLLAGAGERLRQHPAAVAVSQQRLATAVTYADLALALGRYADAATALQPLASEEPLHEPLQARLMLALAGCGQQADALRLFGDVRARLADELGVDPGAELQAAHVRVLRGELPAARAPAGAAGEATAAPPATASPAAVPAELPTTIASFTGRAGQLTQLAELASTHREEALAVGVIAITGTAGVGKTSLAVHFAHQVRDQYPDGQLFVNLRGYARTPPLRPLQALARLLGALGVDPDRVPADEEQAAGLYRSLLADRRLLLVLDNAVDADQVRPLLPGTAGCLVLVTSRDRLGGLVAHDDARRLGLGMLTPAEAVDLLGRLLGEERVSAEPAATAELAGLCAHLPLALRLAAANLADQPRRPVAAYAAELRAGGRLAGLALDDDEHEAVRAAFELSYRRLPDPARSLFQRLGLVPGPDVTAEAAAALAGTTSERAARLLRRLAAVHLLDQPAPGRFGFHDLLRDYAAECGQRENSGRDLAEALRRLFDWYLTATGAAARLLYPAAARLPLPTGDPEPPPAFADHVQALAWLDAERPNLVAAIQHAAGQGPRAVAWRLADSLRGYFRLRRLNVDWLATAEAGLAAAADGGEPEAHAALRLSLGDANQAVGRHAAAIEHYTIGLELARENGLLESQAAIQANVGSLLGDLGQLEQAVDHLTAALALNRQTGRRGGQANNLVNLGIAEWELGRLEQAAQSQAHALALYQEIGSRDGEAAAYGNLGAILRDLGRLDEAEKHLAQALLLNREVGDRQGVAETQIELALVHSDAGRHTEALELAEAALALTREIDDPRSQADALNTLARARRRAGDPLSAIHHHRHALRLARQLGTRYTETVALVGLAAAERDRGRPEQAIAHASSALALTRGGGYRTLEGEALALLAGLHLAGGDSGPATEHARQALDLQRTTGHALGQAHALLILGHALCATGDPGAATSCWDQALTLFASIGAPEAGEARALLHGPSGVE